MNFWPVGIGNKFRKSELQKNHTKQWYVLDWKVTFFQHKHFYLQSGFLIKKLFWLLSYLRGKYPLTTLRENFQKMWHVGQQAQIQPHLYSARFFSITMSCGSVKNRWLLQASHYSARPALHYKSKMSNLTLVNFLQICHWLGGLVDRSGKFFWLRPNLAGQNSFFEA